MIGIRFMLDKTSKPYSITSRNDLVISIKIYTPNLCKTVNDHCHCHYKPSEVLKMLRGNQYVYMNINPSNMNFYTIYNYK